VKRESGLRGVLRTAVAFAAVRRTPYGLGPALTLMILGLFGGLGSSFFQIAGPNIAQDLNLDLRTVGGILATVGTVGLAGSLFFGWLSDRSNRVRITGLSLVANGASHMAQSAATGAGLYASAAVVGSVASISGQTASRPLMADFYPVEARGRVFAMLATVGEVTTLISLLVVGLLVTALGWRTTNLILFAPGIVIGFVFLFLFKEPKRGYFEKKALGFDDETASREDEPQSFGEAWRTIWSIRMMRRFALAILVGQIGFESTKFMPFLLAEHYRLGPAARGAFAFPTVIALFAGGLVGAGFIDYLGQRSPSSVLRILGVVGMAPIVSFGVLALQPPIPVLVFGLMLSSFTQGVFVTSFQSILSQVIPAKVRGQGFVVLSLAYIPGNLALGIVYGPIVSTYGFPAMWLTAIPFLVVMGLLMVSMADYYEVDRRNAILSTAVDEEARQAEEAGNLKLLLCRGINVFYDGSQVLFGVDFEVNEGEIVALLGTNGAGKSTLLRAISGTHEASDGAIVLDGRDITHMPPHEIAARGVVHMPGGRGVFPGLTVEENLRLGTWLAGSEKEQELLEEAYSTFPVLRERRGQAARLLSGGEQQMLSLAQAFMARPKLLMIDELTLGLSPAAVAELTKQVRAINERGTTVVIVEQSVNVALAIAERAVFMEKGEVRFVGETADLLRRPDILRSVYVRGSGGAVPHRVRRPDEERVPQRLLDAKGITKRFGGVTAVDGVDIALDDNQIVGVIGPNGSGKTTLFDILSGYQTPDDGTVAFEGRDVTALPAHERAKLGLVRRFQDARLFPSLTVLDSLMVAFDQRLDSRSAVGAALGLPRARRSERQARQRAERLIEMLDIGAFRDKFIKELSTGLRRIVDLAWVLATEPKVLLLDEPSSGIAQAEVELFPPLLRRVRNETGCSILIVEHHIPLVAGIADELVCMALGRVIARGLPEDVLDDEQVARAFLGEEAKVKG
jgi:ABC-type branched-subunit amino acid transport system ATPase component/MFS family permease